MFICINSCTYCRDVPGFHSSHPSSPIPVQVIPISILYFQTTYPYPHHKPAKSVPTPSLHFNGHFPGERGLAGDYWSKGWWRWWWQLDYWSYKSCKAPVKSSPPTNFQFFYRLDGLPVAQPTVSKHLRENITFHGLAYPKLTWGSSNFVSDHKQLLVTLGEGCRTSHQPSDASTPSPPYSGATQSLAHAIPAKVIRAVKLSTFSIMTIQYYTYTHTLHFNGHFSRLTSAIRFYRTMEVVRPLSRWKFAISAAIILAAENLPQKVRLIRISAEFW